MRAISSSGSVSAWTPHSGSIHHPDSPPSLSSRPFQMALYFCTGVLKDETLFRHYALNVPFYTHFTSPIRRYADVLVHRLLSASLGGCHGALGAAGGGGGCPRTARAPGSLPRLPWMQGAWGLCPTGQLPGTGVSSASGDVKNGYLGPGCCGESLEEEYGLDVVSCFLLRCQRPHQAGERCPAEASRPLQRPQDGLQEGAGAQR